MINNQEFTEKLRSAGLRPTQQRLIICQLLFDRNETFHFTIDDISKIIKRNTNKKISLATIYNTVNSLKNKGHIQKIFTNSDKKYYDTNTSSHHHLIDETTNEIIDLKPSDVESIKIKKKLSKKKIKSIEVIVKIED